MALVNSAIHHLRYCVYVIFILITISSCKDKVENVIKTSNVPIAKSIVKNKEPETVDTTVKTDKQLVNKDVSLPSEDLEKTIKSKSVITKPTSVTSKIIADSIIFEEIVFNYDTITAGDKVQRDFIFINRNKVDIEVNFVKPDCGCTSPSYPFLPIESGQKGKIGVDFNSVGKNGPQESIITLGFKDLKKEFQLKLIGFVKEKD